MAGIPGAVTYYTAAGAPNPAFVEMFAAEKGIDLLSLAHVIDLGGGTNYHRSGEYAKKNPAGGTPYLEFEDGTVISETVVLCELLDNYGSDEKLCGATPMEKATVSMWLRRVEQHIVLPMFNHFRWGPAKDFFAEKGMHGMLANDSASAQQLEVAHSQMLWLDGLMTEQGSDFIAGDKISICDCMLFVMIEYWDPSFGSVITNDWFAECPWVSGWYKRVGARPSAAANKINAAMAPTASL